MNKSKKNVTATSSKLLTPCRSVGLTRKRKQVTKSPTQNENNINSFNENSSEGSQDTVEQSASKLKNLRKKQKIIHEENYECDEFQPIQKFKTSRNKQKTNCEDILESSAIPETGNENFSVSVDHVVEKKFKPVVKLKTRKNAKIHDEVTSVEDEKSSGSQDNVEDEKKSKLVRLKSRKKAKIHDNEIFEAPVIPEAGNENNNSVEDEKSSGSQDNVEDEKKSKLVKLKSRKKAKIHHNDEVLEAPVVISEPGNENNNSFQDEKSSGSQDNVEDEKKSKLVRLKSRKKAKIHDNEIFEAPVIPEAGNQNNNSVEDEKSSGSQDNVEDEKKSKLVRLKSRKNAKIHDNEIFEAPVIPEAGNENNNSVEDEKSSGSQDNVENEKKSKLVKLKSRKKAKIHHNDGVLEAPVVIPEAGNENNNSVEDETSSASQDNVEDEKKFKLVKLKSRKMTKIHDNEVLEAPVVIPEAGNENNNSVEDEKSSESQDNVEDEKKSKLVKLKSGKKVKTHDNDEVLEAPVVIPVAGNENNNSVEHKNSSGSRDNVEFVKESKNANLISPKKTKIYDEEILDIPVIPETGNENINSVNDANSSRNDDNLEDVKQSKQVKLKSREKAKIHDEEILEKPIVIDKNSLGNQVNVKDVKKSKNVKLKSRKKAKMYDKFLEEPAVTPETQTIDDENYSGTCDSVEYEKLSSQKKTENSVVPDIIDESFCGGGENIEDVEKLQDNENSNTENHFNENSSTTSEDSEPLSIWKTRIEQKTNVGQQKLPKNEEKYLEPSESAKQNMKTTQIFVNLVRCDLLLEELRKSNSSLATSQEYLDDEVANINKASTYLETETNVEISKKKRTSLGTVRQSVTKKQSPVKTEKRKTDLKNKSTESLKSNISVSNDYNELSDFSPTVKPRGRKSSSAVKIGKPSPKPIKKNFPKQIAPNKTLPVVKKADSDDDFVEKIPRNRTNTEIEYIKRERVKIGENNSYTIVQRNNMISYIKSNDSSSIVKPDDSVQNISPNICILDHKNYLPDTTPSQAVDSMFDNFVADEESKMYKKPVERTKEKSIDFEKKQLLERKASLMKKVKDRHDKLERLKRISVYKQEHNLKDLQELALQIKRGLQEALVDLLCQLKDQQEKPYTMQSLLKNFSIPFELVGYNLDDDNFV